MSSTRKKPGGLRGPARAGKRPFYEEKSFRELQREAYGLLEAAGFVDIEHTDPSRAVDGGFAPRTPGRFTEGSRDPGGGPGRQRAFDAPFKAEYFRAAESVARDAMDGRTPFWAAVSMAMHSQGRSNAACARAVGKGEDALSGLVKEVREKVNDLVGWVPP